MTKLRHYDNLGTARFVTFSCYRRIEVFRDEVAAEIFIRNLDRLRRDHGVRILGYVVMPDHVHLVLHPQISVRLGVVIGQMKGRSAREIVLSWQERSIPIPGQMRRMRGTLINHSVWEKRCYDHNCRTPDTVREKINYCHNNPVSKGLVAEPGEWRWSSWQWYRGDCDVPLEIDPINPP
jgi:putative transposase